MYAIDQPGGAVHAFMLDHASQREAVPFAAARYEPNTTLWYTNAIDAGFRATSWSGAASHVFELGYLATCTYRVRHGNGTGRGWPAS